MVSAAKVKQLDVRPYLRKKREPFQLIMNTVNELQKDEILLLHAPFKPTPLLGILKMKGYINRMESNAPGHWLVAFAHRSQGKKRLDELDLLMFADVEEGSIDEEAAGEKVDGIPAHGVQAAEGFQHIPHVCRVTELDNRGLEPPKPMVRTLKALEQCASGDRVVIHNDRVPMFLIEELQGLGYQYQVAEQPDGSAIVTILKS